MDHAAEFLKENRAFAELIRGADESLPVPTCPGWSLQKLFRHVGRGDRWAAQIVRDRRDSSLDFRAVEAGTPPPEPDGAISWLIDGGQLLVDAVVSSGAETPVWTFLGTRPAKWWIRRRLHEVVVHRADAALALDAEFSLDAEVAADAITEWLERVEVKAGSDGAALPLEEGHTLHLHATDPGLAEAGEWTIGASGEGIGWSRAHGKATVALRGGAAEILLAILRRVPLADTGIQAFGDAAVLQTWLDRTPL